MKDKKFTKITSIRVDPELWKDARIQTIRDNITLQELIDEALRRELNRRRREKDG